MISVAEPNHRYPFVCAMLVFRRVRRVQWIRGREVPGGEERPGAESAENCLCIFIGNFQNLENMGVEGAAEKSTLRVRGRTCYLFVSSSSPL